MIIDRHPGPARETRALGVQARTLEIYPHLGVADAALALGKAPPAPTSGPRGITRPDPAGRHRAWMESPYPFLLILGQDDNEQMLGENLRKLGMEVQWSTELVGCAGRRGARRR